MRSKSDGVDFCVVRFDSGGRLERRPSSARVPAVAITSASFLARSARKLTARAFCRLLRKQRWTPASNATRRPRNIAHQLVVLRLDLARRLTSTIAVCPLYTASGSITASAFVYPLISLRPAQHQLPPLKHAQDELTSGRPSCRPTRSASALPSQT